MVVKEFAALVAVVHAAFYAHGAPTASTSDRRVPSSLLRQLTESQLEKAVIAEHGDLILLLRNSYRQLTSTLRDLEEVQRSLQVSILLVHEAIDVTFYLEDSLVLNAPDDSSVIGRISNLLYAVSHTPLEHIVVSARPCLRPEFWIRMLFANHSDLPEVLLTRELGTKFQSFVNGWTLEIVQSIDKTLMQRDEIISKVPDGVPPSIVFGREFNTIKK
ncbi:Uncharacterized protein PBTT_01697 [Plasmodiophora brassicae]